MSAKITLVFCAQALFVQFALSQCTSRAAVTTDRGIIGPVGATSPYGIDTSYGLAGPYGLDAPYGLTAPNGWAAPYALETPCAWAAPAIDFSPTSGGALPVSSASAVPPVGLSVASENAYEGILAAAGELPFVGTVGVDGVLPTAGASVVSHACGNGINAMVSDKTALTPGYIGASYAPATAIAPGLAAPGIAAPALGYRAGWAGKSCGCAL